MTRALAAASALLVLCVLEGCAAAPMAARPVNSLRMSSRGAPGLEGGASLPRLEARMGQDDSPRSALWS